MWRQADLSTGFLSRSDHDLLEHGAPHHLAMHDDFYGAFFYPVPDVEPDTVEAFTQKAREFGLSDRFVEIMVEASRQKIEMVRFDCDGDMIEGLVLFDYEQGTYQKSGFSAGDY